MKKKPVFKLDMSHNTRKFVGLLFILMAFAVLYIATINYYSGFHNIDLAYNYQNIAMMANEALLKYNVSFVTAERAMDNSTIGIISLGDGYRYGVLSMRDAFKEMFLSGILLCVGFILIIFPFEKEKVYK